MLQITRQAAEHLERLRTEKGLDEPVGVRFIRNGSRLGLTSARKPENGDRVVPLDGFAVYLKPDVADAFEQSTIDARTEDQRTTLVLRRRAMAR